MPGRMLKRIRTKKIGRERERRERRERRAGRRGAALGDRACCRVRRHRRRLGLRHRGLLLLFLLRPVNSRNATSMAQYAFFTQERVLLFGR